MSAVWSTRIPWRIIYRNSFFCFKVLPVMVYCRCTGVYAWRLKLVHGTVRNRRRQRKIQETWSTWQNSTFYMYCSGARWWYKIYCLVVQHAVSLSIAWNHLLPNFLYSYRPANDVRSMSSNLPSVQQSAFWMATTFFINWSIGISFPVKSGSLTAYPF